MKTSIDADDMMRGRWVEVWHPGDSKKRVRVWRPWWKRKSTPDTATLAELKRGWVLERGTWHPVDHVLYAIPQQSANVAVSARKLAQIAAVGAATQTTKMVNVNGRRVPLGRREYMGYERLEPGED